MNAEFLFGFMVNLLLGVVFIVGLIFTLTIGALDHSEAEEFNMYCENVESGVWPDYKNEFKYCKK